MIDRPKIQSDHARALAAALVPADLPPVNILIVDDEPRNLVVLETILNEPSYRLVRALSPDQALLALVNDEFALLILDVQMPGMNGFELAQTIKGRRKTSQIPIIFLTAHFNDDAHVLEGYGTGAVDYLHKPLNPAALRSKVAVFTELHRQRRELAMANLKLAEEVVERTRAEDELRRWNALLDERIVERTKALNASNARLRLATQGVGLGFWLWDLASDRWQWETAWPLDALGLPEAEWPTSARELMTRMQPEDAARFAQIRRSAFELAAVHFQGTVTGAGDRVLVVEIDGRDIEAGAGGRTILGTIRDVTERHRVDLRLRESEARYRTLFHSIDEGFCVVDLVLDDGGQVADLRFVETNSAFSRHSGLGDVVGQLASAHLPELEQDWRDELGQVAREGTSFRRRGTMRSLQRIVDVHGFPVEESGRRSVGMLFRDVTESERAHDALLERERFLTTVTQAARLGIAVIDASYHYRFVNESFRRILHAAGPIEVGQPVGSLNPQRWAKTRPAVDRALAGESLSIEFTVPGAPTPDGGPTTTHICAFIEPHTDVNASTTAAIVLIDISAVKQLEAELRAADRHKDEFLATLAHELRNPLAPIRNAVGILRHTGGMDTNAIKAGAMIERQVKVMARLIDDLMDVARINQGRLELRLSEVHLQDVVDLAVEACRPLIEEGRHELVVALPPLPLMLLADQTRLAQVFTNILTNAAKYTEAGGHIAIRAAVEAGAVRIAISDDGIGIAQENIARVFEMFSQVEVALARSRGGLGIGLSLAKRLVELHGGTLVARSEGLGRGSEFEVSLPTAVPIVTASDARLPTPGVLATGLRVLVVDDNVDGAESLAALLQIHGFSVALAFDGAQALEVAEASRPQVVLLDIGLPKLNGYEVCKRLRAMPWAGDTRIIAITGWGDPAAKQMAVEAGFDRHFVKPINEAQLLQTIAELHR